MLNFIKKNKHLTSFLHYAIVVSLSANKVSECRSLQHPVQLPEQARGDGPERSRHLHQSGTDGGAGGTEWLRQVNHHIPSPEILRPDPWLNCKRELFSQFSYQIVLESFPYGLSYGLIVCGNSTSVSLLTSWPMNGPTVSGNFTSVYLLTIIEVLHGLSQGPNVSGNFTSVYLLTVIETHHGLGQGPNVRGNFTLVSLITILLFHSLRRCHILQGSFIWVSLLVKRVTFHDLTCYQKGGLCRPCHCVSLIENSYIQLSHRFISCQELHTMIIWGVVFLLSRDLITMIQEDIFTNLFTCYNS